MVLRNVQFTYPVAGEWWPGPRHGATAVQVPVTTAWLERCRGVLLGIGIFHGETPRKSTAKLIILFVLLLTYSHCRTTGSPAALVFVRALGLPSCPRFCVCWVIMLFSRRNAGILLLNQ